MDIKPGQTTKVLRLLQIFLCYLAHTSLLLVCAVYVAHCPYVSMGIVALWGQLPAIEQSQNQC